MRLDRRIDGAPLPVHSDGQTKSDPLGKPQFHDDVGDGGARSDGFVMASTSKSFGQRAEGNDDDFEFIGSFGHVVPSGQGFMNTIPFGSFMTPALEAHSLWKLYEAGESLVEAVRDVNIKIDSGEMVAVMGPSGCGKTTLLNILSGIDEPSSGMVSVNGEKLYGISDDARTDLRGASFGFIFQDFNLLPVLSAAENVELPLLLKGEAPHEARKKALEALEMVGLEDRGEHRPAELSGGQQQRVAVARAIVHQPSIILCDEPTGNLDNNTSKEVMSLLSEMNRNQRTTFLIVTHDANIAAKCQRTITMSDGMVLTDSITTPPEEE